MCLHLLLYFLPQLILFSNLFSPPLLLGPDGHLEAIGLDLLPLLVDLPLQGPAAPGVHRQQGLPLLLDHLGQQGVAVVVQLEPADTQSACGL